MSENKDKLDYIIEVVEGHAAETKRWRHKIEDRLEKTEQQLFLYKTLINIGKTLGALFILIVTLRFGDISKLLGLSHG